MAGSTVARRASARRPESLDAETERIAGLDRVDLEREWRSLHGVRPPSGLPKALLRAVCLHRVQEQAFGGLDRAAEDALRKAARGDEVPRQRPKPGSVLAREFAGTLHEVVVLESGYAWNGIVHDSLSAVARAITGVQWNGPRFFGLRERGDARSTAKPQNRAGATS